MGKLTKAQRDTLVKEIQERKIAVTILSICCPLLFLLCLFIWLVGAYSAHTKFFWTLLIAGIFGLVYGCNLEEERKKKQAQLDEDSE